MIDRDVIVVGAGPAGCLSSILLARAGFSVLLLERARFPRRKVCGEGLMPGGARMLKRLGLLGSLRHRGVHSFEGVSFHLGGSSHLCLDFSEISPGERGWITPREVLDQELARAAAATRGVDLQEGFRVEEVRPREEQVGVEGRQGGRRTRMVARLLVAADGIHSRIPARFGLKSRPGSRRRFALSSVHSNYQGQSDRVEIFCSPCGEAYVAPRGRGEARVTLLLGHALAAEGGPGGESLYHKCLACFPDLLARMDHPHDHGPVQGASPLSLRRSRSHGDRLLLVGDAGGVVDPITGQGISLALQDATLAARVAREAFSRERFAAADLERYTVLRRRHFDAARRTARFLLAILRHAGPARLAAATLRHHGPLRRRLLRGCAGLEAQVGQGRVDDSLKTG